MYVYTLKVTLTVDDAPSHAAAMALVQDAVDEQNKTLQMQRKPQRLMVEDVAIAKKRDQ